MGIVKLTGAALTPIDVNDNRIINVAAPTSGSDAVNRTHLDGELNTKIDVPSDATTTDRIVVYNSTGGSSTVALGALASLDSIRVTDVRVFDYTTGQTQTAATESAALALLYADTTYAHSQGDIAIITWTESGNTQRETLMYTGANQSTAGTTQASDWVDITADTNGTVTSITAGTGLTGDTITSTGTIAVNFSSGTNQGTATMVSRSDHTHEIGGLSGVSISSASDDQFLRYNGTNWVNETVTFTDTNTDALADLTDTTITTPTDNQFLRYDGSAWVNETVTLGGAADSAFQTIAVASQDNVVAESATDTLTLIAGDNVSITTNADDDSITISATDTDTNTEALADLTDTTITSPSDDQFLRYNGSEWVNETVTFTDTDTDALADLTDTTITTPTDDQFLRYNGTAWVNESVTLGEVNVDTNLGLTTASDGDTTLEITSSTGTNVTIPAPVVTSGSQTPGLISGASQDKLDSIAVDVTNRTVTDGTNTVTLAPEGAQANVDTDLGLSASSDGDTTLTITSSTGDNVTIPAPVGTSGSQTPGIMSGADKAKLDSIASGAEANVNSFAVISVDGAARDITADEEQADVEFIGGTGVDLTVGAAGTDTITIALDTDARPTAGRKFLRVNQTGTGSSATFTVETADEEPRPAILHDDNQLLIPDNLITGGTSIDVAGNPTAEIALRASGTISHTLSDNDPVIFKTNDTTSGLAIDRWYRGQVRTNSSTSELLIDNIVNADGESQSASLTTGTGVSANSIDFYTAFAINLNEQVTNLGRTRSASSVTITSSTGTDATIAQANQLEAGVMSSADKTKLDGIAAGAEANVQADWNVLTNTSDAFIRNKPVIPGDLILEGQTLQLESGGSGFGTGVDLSSVGRTIIDIRLDSDDAAQNRTRNQALAALYANTDAKEAGDLFTVIWTDAVDGTQVESFAYTGADLVSGSGASSSNDWEGVDDQSAQVDDLIEEVEKLAIRVGAITDANADFYAWPYVNYTDANDFDPGANYRTRVTTANNRKYIPAGPTFGYHKTVLLPQDEGFSSDRDLLVAENNLERALNQATFQSSTINGYQITEDYAVGDIVYSTDSAYDSGEEGQLYICIQAYNFPSSFQLNNEAYWEKCVVGVQFMAGGDFDAGGRVVSGFVMRPSPELVSIPAQRGRDTDYTAWEFVPEYSPPYLDSALDHTGVAVLTIVSETRLNPTTEFDSTATTMRVFMTEEQRDTIAVDIANSQTVHCEFQEEENGIITNQDTEITAITAIERVERATVGGDIVRDGRTFASITISGRRNIRTRTLQPNIESRIHIYHSSSRPDNHLAYLDPNLTIETGLPGIFRDGRTLRSVSDVGISAAGDYSLRVTRDSSGSYTSSLVAESTISGSDTLSGLSDTSISTPADDEFLRFDGTNWVNEAVTIGNANTSDIAITIDSDGDLVLNTGITKQDIRTFIEANRVITNPSTTANATVRIQDGETWIYDIEHVYYNGSGGIVDVTLGAQGQLPNNPPDNRLTKVGTQAGNGLILNSTNETALDIQLRANSGLEVDATGLAVDFGTGENEVAEGNHTHAIGNLRDVADASSPTAGSKYELQRNATNDGYDIVEAVDNTGTAATNLDIAALVDGATTIEVTSSSGTNATLPAPVPTEGSQTPGVMSGADKAKLDGLEAGPLDGYTATNSPSLATPVLKFNGTTNEVTWSADNNDNSDTKVRAQTTRGNNATVTIPARELYVYDAATVYLNNTDSEVEITLTSTGALPATLPSALIRISQDTDTTYSAGNGVAINSSNSISLNTRVNAVSENTSGLNFDSSGRVGVIFTGNGTASSAARSDHSHTLTNLLDVTATDGAGNIIRSDGSDWVTESNVKIDSGVVNGVSDLVITATDNGSYAVNKNSLDREIENLIPTTTAVLQGIEYETEPGYNINLSAASYLVISGNGFSRSGGSNIQLRFRNSTTTPKATVQGLFTNGSDWYLYDDGGTTATRTDQPDLVLHVVDNNAGDLDDGFLIEFHVVRGRVPTSSSILIDQSIDLLGEWYTKTTHADPLVLQENTDGSYEFVAKPQAAETIATDSDNTLATKSYVDRSDVATSRLTGTISASTISGGTLPSNVLPDITYGDVFTFSASSATLSGTTASAFVEAWATANVTESRGISPAPITGTVGNTSASILNSGDVVIVRDTSGTETVRTTYLYTGSDNTAGRGTGTGPDAANFHVISSTSGAITQADGDARYVRIGTRASGRRIPYIGTAADGSGDGSQGGYANVAVDDGGVTALTNGDSTLRIRGGTGITASLTQSASQSQFTLSTDAEENQNTYAQIRVQNSNGSNKANGLLNSTAKRDIVEFRDGTNLTITPTAGSDRLTFESDPGIIKQPETGETTITTVVGKLYRGTFGDGENGIYLANNAVSLASTTDIHDEAEGDNPNYTQVGGATVNATQVFQQIQQFNAGVSLGTIPTNNRPANSNPGAQITSINISHYTEGTWTGTFSAAVPSSLTPTVGGEVLTRIGQEAIVRGYITIPNNNTDPTGTRNATSQVQINGLPYNAVAPHTVGGWTYDDAQDGTNAHFGVVRTFPGSTNNQSMSFWKEDGTRFTYQDWYDSADGTAPNNDKRIYFQIQYQIDTTT